MSPLNAPPARGYPDGQRLQNYDTPLLLNANGVTINPSYSSAGIDVSRFEGIGMRLLPAVDTTTVQFAWFLDPGLLTLSGARQFQLATEILAVLLGTISNQGPFLQVSISGGAPGSIMNTAVFYATNRLPPLEITPSVVPLIDVQGVVLGAGLTATTYPTGYYAGPVNIWAEFNVAAWNVTLQYLTTNGVWDDFDQVGVGASGGTRLTSVVPPGAWRVQVTNGTGGSGSYFLAVTPSTTGAS